MLETNRTVVYAVASVATVCIGALDNAGSISAADGLVKQLQAFATFWCLNQGHAPPADELNGHAARSGRTHTAVAVLTASDGLLLRLRLLSLLIGTKTPQNIKQAGKSGLHMIKGGLDAVVELSHALREIAPTLGPELEAAEVLTGTLQQLVVSSAPRPQPVQIQLAGWAAPLHKSVPLCDGAACTGMCVCSKLPVVTSGHTQNPADGGAGAGGVGGSCSGGNSSNGQRSAATVLVPAAAMIPGCVHRSVWKQLGPTVASPLVNPCRPLHRKPRLDPMSEATCE
jgi:hypothetical protein